MRVDLTDYTVTIKDSITWGESQEVKAVLLSGAQMGLGGLQGIDPKVVIQANMKLLEIAVKTISPKAGGDEIPFSADWMNGLPQDDGDTLFAAVDALQKKR